MAGGLKLKALGGLFFVATNSALLFAFDPSPYLFLNEIDLFPNPDMRDFPLLHHTEECSPRDLEKVRHVLDGPKRFRGGCHSSIIGNRFRVSNKP